MFTYRLTSLVLGFVIAGVIIQLVRRDLLHTRYSVLWFLIAIAAVVFGAFPHLNDWIAVKLGVHYPPILFIITGMGIILIKILTMDIDRSKQEQKLRILNEKIAILEGEKHSGARKQENHRSTFCPNDQIDPHHRLS